MAQKFYTLEEAQKYLRDNFEKGTNCPCCGQWVKRYSRKLNSGMARILIEIYRVDQTLTADKWMHIHKTMTARKLNATNMEYSKLKYWGFIESKNESDLPDKKSTGFWRITTKGQAFVEAKIRVPSHIILSRSSKQKMLGFEGDEIDIYNALGSKFSYNELMGKIV